MASAWYVLVDSITAVWMAAQAGIEFVDVVPDFIMLIIHLSFGVFMTGAQATE